MSELEPLLDRLEELLESVEELDEPARSQVLELLDGIDALHRRALRLLPEALGPEAVERLRRADPALRWLLVAYDVGLDEHAAAEAALAEIRPYVESHGGRVELLGVRDGLVRLRLAGACSGCTASAVTLREGVERALRERLPGYAGLEVAQDEAPAHPPPGPTLLQIDPLAS